MYMCMNWDILTRALQNDVSDEEQALLTEWLNSSARNRDIWIGLQAKQYLLNSLASEEVRTANWRQLQDRLQQMPVRSLRPVYWWKGIAASAAIIIGMVFLSSIFRMDISTEQQTSNLARISSIDGESKRIILPDGSIVWLHHHSSIEFDSVLFNKQKREVQLTGDAFFDVAKNKKKPFVIQVGGMEIGVVGTSFAVYAGNPDMHLVEVATGIVRVTAGNRNEQLVAGNALSYNILTGQVLRNNVSINEARALKGDALFFEKDDLQTIVQKLRYWYHRKITVEGSPGKPLSFTGVVKDDGIEAVLNGLAYMAGFTYKINGHEIIIYPQH